MTPPMDAATALDWFTTPRRPPTIEAAAPVMAQAERVAFAHAGSQLAIWRWGESDGPTALLVHGWEGSAAQFHGLVPELLAAGYRVVAPDLPAHGASAGRRADPVAFGRAVAAIGTALANGSGGLPAMPVDSLIGHSVGSAAGLWAFAAGLTVQRSMHLAGPSSLLRAADRFVQALGLSAAEGERFRARLPKITGPRTDLMELHAVLPGLRHPALLLHDPDDRIVPYGDSEALAAAWPGAALLPLPGAGHAGILEDERMRMAVRGFLPGMAAAA